MRVNRMILLALALAVLAVGCVPAATVPQEAPGGGGPSVITAMNFYDAAIEVAASGPFTYSMYKPMDPYTIVVELPGVMPGDYLGANPSGAMPVSEVLVSSMEEPMEGTRLEFRLQGPAELKPTYAENVLTLAVESESQQWTAEDAFAAVTNIEAAIPVDVEVRPPLEKATEIQGIRLDYKRGKSELTITTDGATVPNVFALKHRIVVDVPEVEMKTTLPFRVQAPVKAVRSGSYPDKVRIVIDLIEDIKFEANTIDESIVITMFPTTPYWDSVEAEEALETISEDGEITETSMEGGGITASGQMISLDFQEADIKPIIRMLAQVAGYNVVLHKDVTGQVTMKLNNVPWETAVEIILRDNDLDKSIKDNILYVAPMRIFQERKQRQEQAAATNLRVEPLLQSVIKLNYAEAANVVSAITAANIQSPRGKLTVDSRMNTLIIKDTAESITNMRDLIAILDVSKDQVMIEAKLVEVRNDFAEQLGIRWGGDFTADNYPPIAGVFGVNGPPTADPNIDGLATSGGAVNMSIGTASTIKINLALDALETAQRAKTLSNPKVLTLDGEEASIQQGESIPVQTTTAEGTTTQFIDANLNLSVTPRIAPNGYVQMEIAANNDRADLLGNGELGIRKQGVNTQAIVKDGETLVLGGIYTSSETSSETSVPGLSRLPLLGWLFQNKSQTGPSSSELLIMITPKIVKRAAAI